MNLGQLKKYCSNRCTDEELSSVLAWFEESARSPEGKAILWKIWDEISEDENNPKGDFDLLLDRLHHEINLTQSRKLLNISGQNLVKYKRKERFIRILTRVAAILLLPVLGFGLYMSVKDLSAKYSPNITNLSYNEVFSSVDAITKISLPDGSYVWLNHSSRLKYPAKFHRDFRTVELIGEGYFEVADNPKVPFIVKAGEIQVKALGTTFNIMAYSDEDMIETSLIEGRVELERIEQNGVTTPLLNMKPTDFAVFRKSNNEISIRTTEDDRYFSWKDGKLVFNDEPMDEVVKKLSRWFNVDIQLKDPELLELSYTATFVQETLTQVLDLLSLMSPVSYLITSREEISPGHYSREKVFISYRSK